MAKFHLHLKGYVGAEDFRTKDVDRCLRENADNDVRVLIDSTGGSLGSGLSIAAAFKNHGAVDVHFVGLNASAATVASLGARTITMDRGAMYLVHKCSNFVFAWQSMNADELEQFINDLVKNKKDLDKIDDNIAAMYAARCRKDKKALLELMKEGGWLSPKEALEWGFIDKITDFKEDEKTSITACLAEDLKAAGIPLPGKIEKEEDSVSGILSSVKKFFGLDKKDPKDNGTEKEETPEDSELKDSSDNSVISDPDISDNSDSSINSNQDHAAFNTKRVIENSAGSKPEPSSLGSFIDTGISARKLFDSLP